MSHGGIAILGLSREYSRNLVCALIYPERTFGAQSPHHEPQSVPSTDISEVSIHKVSFCKDYWVPGLFWAWSGYSRLDKHRYRQRCGAKPAVLVLDACEGPSSQSNTLIGGHSRDAVLSILATLARQQRLGLSERTLGDLGKARKKGRLIRTAHFLQTCASIWSNKL